mmetsp:Transcript_4436/g.5096  ORF Transcript_4436/g.5096 Transcript_4436/m.5096 type:complete len:153 (+) Transcript_4436:417-875(+)
MNFFSIMADYNHRYFVSQGLFNPNYPERREGEIAFKKRICVCRFSLKHYQECINPRILTCKIELKFIKSKGKPTLRPIGALIIIRKSSKTNQLEFWKKVKEANRALRFQETSSSSDESLVETQLWKMRNEIDELKFKLDYITTPDFKIINKQ